MMSPAPVTADSTLVTPSPTLPLVGAALRVEARGGIARVILEQRFRNPHRDPLAVTYVLPLPADGAVSGFAFTIGDRRIEGDVDRKRAARERFEEAIAQGKTAALLDQERSSLFTQELGNVPPGAEVVCEITIDQRLRWLDEGSWEWRFPLAAAPRYLGAPGRTEDAAKIALEVARTLAPRASLHMAVLDELAAGRSPESPSHALQVGAGRVELGGGNRAELDRDVVVRWQVAALAPSVQAAAERTARHADAHALVTIVPPAPGARADSVARDLIVLLDTSGSMSGAPLDQARRVAMALVDGLGERDQIELVEFSNSPRRFARRAVFATKENKRAALDWLARLRASGGTEMKDGILEALRPLRANSQRQVVLVTDGLIGFEQEIVDTILERLPAGCRVHTVGVGSAVNRSLTAPAARAGRGVEVVIGLGEDPERAVARLRARTEAPLVVDVTVGGAALVETAPARVPDLYAGAPVLVSARVRPEGGELVVRGRTATGTWEERVRVSPRDGSGVLATLFGREAVEDAETRLAAGASRADTDGEVERLGLEYRIATRLTSWVAIDKTPSVDPRAPSRRESVPQMLPHGMSVEGLGLREAAESRSYMVSAAAVAGPTGAPPAPRAGAPMQAMRARASGGFAPSRPGAPPSAPPPPMVRPEPVAEDEGVDVEDRSATLDEELAAPKERAEEGRARRSPAPEGKGALRRLVDRLAGAFGGAPAELRGRVVSRKGNELVLEIEATGDFDWDLEALAGAVARVWLDDGTYVEAAVEAERCTRSGRLEAGQRARLVLALAHPPAHAARHVDFEPDLGITIPLA